MTFIVLPALPTDVKAVYDVYFRAFKDNAITRAFFPSAKIEDLLNSESEFRQIHAAHVLDYAQKDPTQYTLKCVDCETGEVVGMALWDIYLTPSKWRRPEISWLEGEEREDAESLISPLWETREKLWLDQKYVYCHVVAVDPSSQKKGIGQLLMEYGISVAERVELPIYIESSRDAERLYEKLGCRRLRNPQSDTLHADGSSGNNQPAIFVWYLKRQEDELPRSVKMALN